MAYRTSQVANILGLNARAVQKLAWNGYLKARKHADGLHWLFEKEDLAEFILSNPHYKRKFMNTEPNQRYRDSYNIILEEVQKRDAHQCERDKKDI